MNSILVPIAFFEERYKISNDGSVLNLANNENLTPIKDPSGVLKVGLATGDGGRKQVAIHTLVAQHFIPNPYGHVQVAHKDGDKTNNHVDNLEWVSHEQTAQRALKAGVRPGYMSADDKELYLLMVLDGQQVKDLAKKLDRRPETLHKMLRKTADRLNVRDEWDARMKENRRNAALKNLARIKPKRKRISLNPSFKRDRKL